MTRFMAAGLLALGVATPALGQDTVAVSVGGELSTFSSSTVRVPISVDMRKAPGERLGSYTVRVTWPTSLLSYRSVAPGQFGTPTLRTDSVSFGVLKATGVNVAGLDSVFSLFDVNLFNFGNGTGSITVQVTEMSGIQPTFTDFVVTGTILVTNGTFCPALGRWGDLDADGQANSRDALAILSDGVGLPVDTTIFDLSLGDVDDDGQRNTRDALILISFAVGIPIPGQRVLLLVPGPACGTGATPTLSLIPDTVDLVIGQTVRMQARASDAAGTGTLAAKLNWTTADPNVAVVDTAGNVTVRGPGTTTVTVGLGPGVMATSTVIGMTRRGTWHVNAQVASGTAVMTGSPRLPFDTPERVFGLLSEGDTILIGPGVTGYLDLGSDIPVGAVIVGDTSGGRTRPILRARPQDFVTGANWTGGGHAEMRNLELEGFWIGIETSGVRNLTLDNVMVRANSTNALYGLYLQRAIDTVLVMSSTFVGDTTSSSIGLYGPSGVRVFALRDSRIETWGSDGLNANDVDSLDMVRTTIRLNRGLGLALNRSTAPDGAAVVSQSVFDDNRGDAVSIVKGRTVAMDHNFIRTRQSGSAVAVTGSTLPGGAPTGRFTSTGDSIEFLASNRFWYNLTALDSVTVDSLWLGAPMDTLIAQFSTIRSNVATFRNVQLLNLFSQGINFFGRHLSVDNSTFSGCLVQCTWTNTDAIQAVAGNDSGPQLDITNSTFFNFRYAVRSQPSADSSGPAILANNTVDSVRYGFALRSDSVVATDNILTRVDQRAFDILRTGTNKPTELATVARNTVSCLGAVSSYGILVQDTPAQIIDNTVNNCYYGIYVSNSTSTSSAYRLEPVSILRDTVNQAAGNLYGIYVSGRVLPTVSHNTVRNSPNYGIYLLPNLLPGDAAVMAVDSNAVSGAGLAGIRISPADSMDVTGQYNNVSNNVLDGILNTNGPGFGPRSFRNGRFVGNGRWAVSSVSQSFDASLNWWGDAGGPGGPAPGNGGQLADSVTNVNNVTVTGFLTADPGNTPSLAPPGFPPPSSDRVPTAVPEATATVPLLAEPADRAWRAAADQDRSEMLERNRRLRLELAERERAVRLWRATRGSRTPATRSARQRVNETDRVPG